jgi:tetratricopeptide (TPR) repeat protein
MSLLMDALKRAETSKKEVARNLTGGEPGRNASDFSLEPIPARSPNAGQPLPNLALHIDSLNADLEASAPPAMVATPPPIQPQTAAPTSSEEEHRAAIRNAFAAKETKPPSRQPLWLALGTLGLAAVGIGGYVWYQLQGMSQGSLRAANSSTPTTIAPLPGRPATIPAPQAAAPSPPAVPIFAPNSPSTVTLAENPERPFKPTQRSEPSRYSPPGPARESEAYAPVRLIRTQPEPDTNLQRGYANLQGNSLDLARRDYEQAVRNDPNNVDALLGLAAIAQRQGRSSDAERYQQRALVADPRDAGAQAAALSNNDNGNPTTTESRLKTLLSAQPESAQLNFALGNVYAKQARWNEAQQVYFNAVAGDTSNPDYLFNLAVSLDQLRQPKLAAQHYRMALEAAENRPAAFDRERANKRLNQLAP